MALGVPAGFLETWVKGQARCAGWGMGTLTGTKGPQGPMQCAPRGTVCYKASPDVGLGRCRHSADKSAVALCGRVAVVSH